MTPQAFVDSMAPPFKQAWETLGCEYDDFVRTTEPRHKERVHELWKRALASGDYSARVDVSSADEIGELGLAFNRMGESLQQIERQMQLPVDQRIVVVDRRQLLESAAPVVVAHGIALVVDQLQHGLRRGATDVRTSSRAIRVHGIGQPLD